MSEFREHPLDSRLGLLTSMWAEKLRFARDERAEFDLVAAQCRMFYTNSQKFWADSKTKNLYIKDASIKPSFNLSICKAFELVALYGPLLYWRNPQRHVSPRKPVPVIPELFDPPPEMLQNPPPPPPQQPLPPGAPPQQQPSPQQQMEQMIQQYRQQMAQQVSRQQSERHSIATVRAELQEQVLNWLPTQQPNGGLAAHSRRAITDALLTGRGCLWTSMYQHPGSDSTLCGSFWRPPEDLLIDPDAVLPDLSDAYWIARRVVEPVWLVEDKYNLPRGSVKPNLNSAEGLAETDKNSRAHKRKNGQTQDLVEYHIIYSKAGIGKRFKAGKEGQIEFSQEKLLRSLDDAAGDYVHLVIANGTPFPLNLPGEKLSKLMAQPKDEATEAIKQSLKWPIEFWRTGGWPVQIIDFYEDNESVWPIAPLKPAIGELVFLNIILSVMCERVYNSCEDLIGVAMDKFDEFNKQIGQKVGTRRVLKLDQVSGNIAQMVQYLQNPAVNFDVWKMIDWVIKLFEQRTGLTDMLQGQVTTQDRSAEATATRREQMNLRPDDMAARVEAWMTRVACAERIALKSYVQGNDLRRLLGDYGAWLYDKLVTSEELEDVLREVDVTIEAGSARKPNKQREITNLEQVTPMLMPFFQQYAVTTTDTRPVMWLVGRIADAMELDLSGLQLQQLAPPPPPPQVQQQQQAEQQAAVAEHQMSMQMKQADVQAKQMLASQKIQQSQIEHALKLRELEADAQKEQVDAALNQQEARMRMEEKQMEAAVKQQELMQKLQLMAAQAQMQRERIMSPAPMMQEAI